MSRQTIGQVSAPRRDVRALLLWKPWTALRAIPAAAWICALVAFASAVSWSFITPPFQVPDEPDHFAYVKQLAETGSRPSTSREAAYSAEETTALRSLRYIQLRLHPDNRAFISPSGQRKLDQRLKEVAAAGERGSPNAGVATSEPPLYYALESIPYSLGSQGSLLERLQLMRLLTTVIAGVTALFTFLFLREALPRTRWAWTVGALAVALCPLFGFMSGAVNPDAMLYAVAAVLFYSLARTFRRGLTRASAIAIGCVMAVGLLTKLNFLGLVPGTVIALAVMGLRTARRGDSSGLANALVASVIGGSPGVVFVIANVISGHRTLGIAGAFLSNGHRSPADELSYIWQLYLPRLPGMPHDFPYISTARQIWFDGYVGRLGWLDTFFPGWVYTVALLAAGLLAGLCLRGLFAVRDVLRRRALELACYGLIALGLLVIVGASSYHSFPGQVAAYGQTRYMLPLLPLLAAALALAARGAGRRWGPLVGTLIILLFAAHDLFSQLQVIARYYG